MERSVKLSLLIMVREWGARGGRNDVNGRMRSVREG